MLACCTQLRTRLSAVSDAGPSALTLRVYLHRLKHTLLSCQDKCMAYTDMPLLPCLIYVRAYGNLPHVCSAAAGHPQLEAGGAAAAVGTQWGAPGDQLHSITMVRGQGEGCVATLGCAV